MVIGVKVLSTSKPGEQKQDNRDSALKNDIKAKSKKKKITGQYVTTMSC